MTNGGDLVRGFGVEIVLKYFKCLAVFLNLCVAKNLQMRREIF